MDRSFQLQEQKKNSLSRPSALRSTTLLHNESGNPLHSTILSMQQSYGNRYVQEIVSGERMPCPELCGLSEPLAAAPIQPAAHFKPHSCDSCVFHPQRSDKRAVTGVSNPTAGVPLQAKLTIGQPGDVYEQEADSVADMILQRQCTTPECEEEEVIQRQKEDEEEPIQMKQMVTEAESSQDVTEQILQQKGSGGPLEPETRNFMESRFGYDFGKVKVHTDSQAGKIARDLNAEAFTVGRDIYFGSGRYNPASTEGKRLLVHELTHVIQQNGGIISHPVIQRRVQVNPSTTAVDDILNQFRFLCPGSWSRSGQIITGHATAVTNQSCNCLENTVSDPSRTYTINVDAVSNTPQSETLHNGTVETIPYPSSGPRTYNGTNPVTHMPASRGSAMEFGAFEPSGSAAWTPNWRILAHELCGHARLNQSYTGDKGDRPEHNSTIDTENAIAAEHGGAPRGHYNDPRQGESFHNSTANRTRIVFRLVDGWHYEPPLPIPMFPILGNIQGEITASALRIRQGPSTSSPILGLYPRGTIITILCQTTGTSVDGNSLWDRTDRGYVSDRYVSRIRPSFIKLPTC